MDEPSSESQYRDKGLCEQLENYFWPYTASDQVCSSLCLPRWLFCAVRVGALGANLASLGLYLRWEAGEKYVYLTFWGLLLTLLCFGLIMLNYCYTGLWKFAHFAFELNWALTSTTSLLFGIFLPNALSVLESPWRIFVHASMLGAILVELLNNQLYFFRRHFGLIVLIGLLFIGANVVYSMVAGPVYSEMDPANSDYYLILAVGFTFLVLAFVLGGLLDKAKIACVAKRAEDQEFLEEYLERDASILHTIFHHRKRPSA